VGAIINWIQIYTGGSQKLSQPFTAHCANSNGVSHLTKLWVPNVSKVPLGILIIDFILWLCGPWAAFGHWRTYLKWSLINSRICHRVPKMTWVESHLEVPSEPNSSPTHAIAKTKIEGRRISPSTRPPRVSWACRLHGFVSGFERGGREISHGFQLNNDDDVGRVICSFGAFCGRQGFGVYSHWFLKVKFERIFWCLDEDLVVGYSLTRV
jgi:hypothetical protein